MQVPNTLSAALQSLGVCQVFISPDFRAKVTVDTAGAIKGATSVPVKALTAALQAGQVLHFTGSAPVDATLSAAAAVGAVSISTTALPAALVSADVSYPWENIGAIEGDITDNTGAYDTNELTAPQATGGVTHQAQAMPQKPSVTVPVVYGGPRILDLSSPTGSRDGPNDAPTSVVEKSMFLVPITELGTGLGYNGSTWTPAAPVNSLFFGRCFLTRAGLPRPFANGGKSIVPVTITAMYDTRLPAGKRAWIFGDPVAAGVTTFLF